jgi:hypothetical protein
MMGLDTNWMAAFPNLYAGQNISKVRGGARKVPCLAPQLTMVILPLNIPA